MSNSPYEVENTGGIAMSLVLPCYNPLNGWEQSVCSAFYAFCDSIGEQVELMIVLDGVSATVTTDALAFLQKNIPDVKLVQYPLNKGKGYAIRQGVKEATGKVIMYTDIDFPYSPASMFTIYKILKNDECDVAVGVKSEAYYSQVPLLRRAISRYLR